MQRRDREGRTREFPQDTVRYAAIHDRGDPIKDLTTRRIAGMPIARPHVSHGQLDTRLEDWKNWRKIRWQGFFRLIRSPGWQKKKERA